MNFYSLTLLLEGQAEDLINREPKLRIAYNQGIKNHNLLKWVLKVSDKEPVEDILPVVISFEKNKQKLSEKDINFYKTAGQLRLAIEQLGRSGKEEEIHLKENETTKIGQFGDWVVIMPHTRESSCQWGKDTTWCTAATKSGNLFLSYTARPDENIILYYLIKNGSDSRIDPNSKISIGFRDGEPILKGEYGGITVDAQNKGMNESSLKQVLGVQYGPIIQSLMNHSKSIEGKHPAKKQMESLANSDDPTTIDKYISGMKPEEEENFIDNLLNYKISEKVAKHLIELGKITSYTALRSSIKHGDLNMVKLLAKKYVVPMAGLNFNIETLSDNLNELVELAILYFTNIQIIDYLIDMGGDLDVAFRGAVYAPWPHHEQIMKHLIAKGAKDFDGALMLTAQHEEEKNMKAVIEFLAEEGAKKGIKMNFAAAAAYADRNGHKATSQLLKDKQLYQKQKLKFIEQN